MRKVEVLRDGAWVQIRLSEAKINDLIRLFEEDGTPYQDADGETEFYIQVQSTPLAEDPSRSGAQCYGKKEVDEYLANGGTL